MTNSAQPLEATSATAVARNQQPIWSVLGKAISKKATILELGSGSGEHAFHFAPRAAPAVWQPSDSDETVFDSIRAWLRRTDGGHINPPLKLDISETPWRLVPSLAQSVETIVAINLIHYAPPAVTPALFKGAGDILSKGGVLYLYGPFRRGGKHTAPSNERFNRWLKNQDPSFAVRHMEWVTEHARGAGFSAPEIIAMPANNFSLIFKKV